jgi:hypothetical protein
MESHPKSRFGRTLKPLKKREADSYRFEYENENEPLSRHERSRHSTAVMNVSEMQTLDESMENLSCSSTSSKSEATKAGMEEGRNEFKARD